MQLMTSSTQRVHPPAPCRQSVLDVSRGWHAALVAAPELAPTVHLTCVFEDYTEEY